MGADGGVYRSCQEPEARDPIPGGRVRVVEVMATATNGGAQEHVFGLVNRLDPARYDVRVIALSFGSSVRRFERHGIPVCVIDEPDDSLAADLLAGELAPFRPEVIHNHMFRAEMVGTRAGLRLGEVGCGRPFIISTVHSSRVRSSDDKEALRRLSPFMDRLIAVSKSIQHKIADERDSSTPVSLIYNGVDLRRYDHQQPCCTFRGEYGIPQDSPVVGVVARLEPEKGHRTLLMAWPQVLALVPDAWLLVVGEGSEREALESLVKSIGVADRVVFAGRRDDVPAVTAALDVAVLPSYREAQGLSVLEAMALGRPVVASAVGGIPEMIDDGHTGLLVPAQQPDALAEAIVRLLRDHPLADMLGRRGHDQVHDRFCIELMVRAIEDLYDEGARKARAQDPVR